jgi:EmrB/QacA subfamily drug resistance transporter
MDPARPVPDPRPIIFGVLLVLLLASMNQTIVAVALPRIARELDGFSLLAWVISGYLVAATVTTPVYGKLCDRRGPRQVLLVALAIFAAGTLGCALSQSMPTLVGWRVVQGIGGGGLISSANAAISAAVSLRERGRYQGYTAGMFGLGSVVGPVLGGWLTEWVSWQAVFVANLPLAAAAYIATHRALRQLPLPAPAGHRVIDVLGALLLSFGLTALLIAITRVGLGQPMLDSENLRWLGAAAVLLAGYAWRDARAEDPVLPLGLLRRSMVSRGLASQMIGHGTMMTLIVMVPLELQLVAGLPPLAAANQLIALSIGPPLGSAVAGTLMARTGRYRTLQSVGAGLSGTAALALAAVVWLDAPHAIGLMLLFVAGWGFGMQFPTTMVAIQNDLPARNLGTAIAAVNFSRSLGGALGIAVLSTLLLTVLAAGAPDGLTGSTGADVLRALTATDADGLRAQMQPVAERAFALIFALCGVNSLLGMALYLSLPEKRLRA